MCASLPKITSLLSSDILSIHFASLCHNLMCDDQGGKLVDGATFWGVLVMPIQLSFPASSNRCDLSMVGCFDSQTKMVRGRNELCQFRFSFLGPFFQIWQFFVVLHKIGHECIMTLHGHFTKITKKTKHGNVYNDRSTEKNNSQKHGFWTFARSLYKFPCFVFLVVL